MNIQFCKMEGTGNDFIVIDDRDGKIEKVISYEVLAKKVCDRHFGIGGDGLIVVLNSKIDDLKFRIFNSDGSEPQMCGNGMRCFAKFVYENSIINKNIFTIETLAGTVIPKVFIDDKGFVNDIRVDMGEPVLETVKIPFISENTNSKPETIVVDTKEYEIFPVSMGNPHAVIFTDNIDSISLKSIGPKIEVHEKFPEKTNVEFAQIISKKQIVFKVWERGAGITLACGTGACAVLVAAVLSGKTDNKALIELPGGNLSIEWNRENNHIYKTGPAKLVFKGTIEINNNTSIGGTP